MVDVAVVRPGQVLDLAGTRLRVTAGVVGPAGATSGSTATGVVADLVALIVDGKLRCVADDAVVFFNQPSLGGVALVGGALEIDLARLDSGQRVLCAVGLDPAVPGAEPTVTTTLNSEAGVAMTLTGPAHPAQLLWEIYRRPDTERWRVRALGQGYAGGLEQLLTAHGIVVDGGTGDIDGTGDDDAVAEINPLAGPNAVAEINSLAGPNAFAASAPTRGETAPSGESEAGPVVLPPFEPLSPDDHMAGIDRIQAIFEDVARAVQTYCDTVNFAADQGAAQSEAAVADPALRNSPEGERARAEIARVNDELIGAAIARITEDWAYLSAELEQLETHLPRAMAGWDAPRWRKSIAEDSMMAGVRVGRLSPEIAFPLPVEVRVPEVSLTSGGRFVFLNCGAESPAVVGAMRAQAVRRVVRHVKFGPVRTHVISVAKGTGTVAEGLEGLPGLVIHRDVDSALAELERVAHESDLTREAAKNNMLDAISPSIPRHIILDNLPFGWGEDELARLAPLLEASIWPITMSVDWGEEKWPTALRDVIGDSKVFGPSARLIDRWVGIRWAVEFDTLSAEAASQLYAQLADDRATSALTFGAAHNA